MVNTSLFGHGMPGGPGTPSLRPRADSGGNRGLGVGRSISGRSHSRTRGSVVIEEEEEDEGEEEVEEVEAFSPVEVDQGESVDSVTVWDDEHHLSKVWERLGAGDPISEERGNITRN